MCRILQDYGVDVTLSELSGKGHWWWDSFETSDGGAVNDPVMRKFYQKHVQLHQSRPTIPNEFMVRSLNPATFSSKGGITILQMKLRLQHATIHVTIAQENHRDAQTPHKRQTKTQVVWYLNTRNVAMFEVSKSESNGGIDDVGEEKKGFAMDKLVIDGQSFTILNLVPTSSHSDETIAGIVFCWKPNIQRWSHDCNLKNARLPFNYGPARQVFHKPFVIVVGTISRENSNINGSKSSLLLSQHMEIAQYISVSHLHSSATHAPIVLDVDVTDFMANSHNLVLIGGPKHNLWSKKLQHTLPVRFMEDEGNNEKEKGKENVAFEVGGCIFQGNRMGLLFLTKWKGIDWLNAYNQTDSSPLSFPTYNWRNDSSYPNVALIVTGTDYHGLRDIVRFSFAMNQPLTRAPFTNMVPDFMISGPDYVWQGVGGLLGSGYWGNDWAWSKENSFMECTPYTHRGHDDDTETKHHHDEL